MYGFNVMAKRACRETLGVTLVAIATELWLAGTLG
jgi:hypothetical protein